MHAELEQRRAAQDAELRSGIAPPCWRDSAEQQAAVESRGRAVAAALSGIDRDRMRGDPTQQLEQIGADQQPTTPR